MSKHVLTAALAQRKPLKTRNDLVEFRADVAHTLEAHPETQLLIYPEMHLQNAMDLPPEEADKVLREIAVPLTDSFITELGKIAQEFGIWLVPGSIGELAADGYFNTELLFAPTGELVASYRKMFPWRPHEPHDYGKEFIVAPVTRSEYTFAAGLSNCYDSWFPEHTRHLAWQGADFIINVVKTTSEDRAQELILAQANAIANQVYFLSVNCAEPLGRGFSIAVDPEGKVLAQAAGEETTLVVQLDLEKLKAVRERGTCGTNRMWQQFGAGDPQIPLPLYGGAIDTATWTPNNHKENERK